MSRIPLPTPETMTADQRRVYDKVVAGRRGTVQGPLLAALHNPELADRWQALGALLRYETSIPPRLSEVAILVTAQRWASEVEWSIHAPIARAAGVPDSSIDALRRGERPAGADSDILEVRDFAYELQGKGQVSDAAYAAVVARWGAVGVVELTAIIGYYTLVAMTLNVHQIPVPPGVVPDLGTER